MPFIRRVRDKKRHPVRLVVQGDYTEKVRSAQLRLWCAKRISSGWAVICKGITPNKRSASSRVPPRQIKKQARLNYLNSIV